MKYYSVHKGRETGIFTTWDNCKKQIDKYKGAIYKSFKKKEDAEKFVKNGKKNIQVKEKKTKKELNLDMHPYLIPKELKEQIMYLK